MAEFSKQWCDANDHTGIKPDFDIIEVAAELQPEHYASVICEGFGFIAIGKDVLGNILLGMPTDSLDLTEGVEVEWKTYTELVK